MLYITSGLDPSVCFLSFLTPFDNKGKGKWLRGSSYKYLNAEIQCAKKKKNSS